MVVLAELARVSRRGRWDDVPGSGGSVGHGTRPGAMAERWHRVRRVGASGGTDGFDANDLRDMVEFVLTVVREGQKLKPPLDAPTALVRLTRSTKLTPQTCEAVRRILETESGFRERLASVVTPEAVDAIGLAWLRRPEGWQDEVRRLAAERADQAAHADAQRRLRAEERRRVAAEEHRARVLAESVQLRDALADVSDRMAAAEAEVERLREELAELSSELTASQLEARHAHDREVAALRRLEAAVRERTDADDAVDRAKNARDEALADRARTAADRAELAAIATRAGELAARLAALAEVGDVGEEAASRRTPLAVPGGLTGDSVATAEYLFRSGVDVLVDGYNVAMRAWPGRDLVEQRSALLDESENLARRFGGSRFTVVFDGSSVVGAAGTGRRMIRVVFSPEGVEADDVIRDEVGFVPVGRPVVVVTDDAAIVRDVRAAGANHVAAGSFIATFR